MKQYFLIFLILSIIKTVHPQVQGAFNIMNAPNEFRNGDTLVKLFSGDKIKLHGVVNAMGGVILKSEKTKSDSIKLITISLTKENFGSDKGMMLKITNPFDKKLTYKALIGPTKSGKFVETSLIPVKPNLMSIETWPYVFSSIILYDFKLE